MCAYLNTFLNDLIELSVTGMNKIDLIWSWKTMCHVYDIHNLIDQLKTINGMVKWDFVLVTYTDVENVEKNKLKKNYI